MNREYLNIIVADHNEGNLVYFKEIFRDLKIATNVQVFNNGNELIEYLTNDKNVIPEVVFMNYDLKGKHSLDCLEQLKCRRRFENMVNVVYSDNLSEDKIEDIFVTGANIFIKKPDEYTALKKVLTEVITVNWQYYTSGLNKDNFIMKMS